MTPLPDTQLKSCHLENNKMMFPGYSKTCVKRQLKNSKTKILMTNHGFMKVKTIA